MERFAPLLRRRKNAFIKISKTFKMRMFFIRPDGECHYVLKNKCHLSVDFRVAGFKGAVYSGYGVIQAGEKMFTHV
ncbi:MAG: hypothetical protein BWX55_01651 [Deltaproteobacteria bacterium ADurb.Bin022]|nr:MAG: hypothetical protein BWX55_01651 [Deltaproteobacteria bacterium ADurb.Bin022]